MVSVQRKSMTSMLPLALVPLAQDYCGWAEFAQVADATTGTLALDGDTIWGAGADAKLPSFSAGAAVGDLFSSDASPLDELLPSQRDRKPAEVLAGMSP